MYKQKMQSTKVQIGKTVKNKKDCGCGKKTQKTNKA